MKITAAVSRIPSEPLSLESVELDTLQDDEILVRVVATGICHTDIGMRDSATRIPRPIVLGHEGAGIVVKTGKAIGRVMTGDHVVLSFDTCGSCPSCRQGRSAYCLQLGKYNFSGKRLDGSTPLHRHDEAVHGFFFGQSSFATYAVCHERNAILVDKSLSLDMLGPLGCGFQTGAGAVINSLKVKSGQSLVVYGTGAVGLAAIMAAKFVEASTIVAVDTNASRLALAMELGATHTIDASRQDTFSVLRDVAPDGVDFALDTTGNLAVIQGAVASLAPLGTCGLINTAKGADLQANILALVLSGRSIRGIHQGDSNPDEFVPFLIELYRQGLFPFDRLLRYYELDDINAAMDDMHAGRCIKPVIRMPTEAGESRPG